MQQPELAQVAQAWAMTRSWIHFDASPRIVVPGEASKNRVPRTIRMTKRVEALLREPGGGGASAAVRRREPVVGWRGPGGLLLRSRAGSALRKRSAIRR